MENQIKESVHINASAEKVWDTLINPDKSQQYMFNTRILSNWKVGSTVVYEGEWEGRKMVFVNGVVLAYEPYTLLKITLFDTTSPTLKDIPENHLHLSFILTPENGGTRLDMLNEGFERVDEGERRYNDASNGGDQILLALKAVAEN